MHSQTRISGVGERFDEAGTDLQLIAEQSTTRLPIAGRFSAWRIAIRLNSLPGTSNWYKICAARTSRACNLLEPNGSSIWRSSPLGDARKIQEIATSPLACCRCYALLGRTFFRR